jgi:phage shock protein PspC (stress-responsive transcriptional regulator)
MSDREKRNETQPMGGAQSRRRLERRTDDKIVAGVCSGLGDYFDVDPLWFRVGFVVLALTGMTGIVLYFAAWALIPAPGQPPPSARKSSPVTLIGAVLLVVAALIVIPIFISMLRFGFAPFVPNGLGEMGLRAVDYFPGPGVLALALIGIGIVLLRQRDEGRGPLAPRPPTSPADAATMEAGLAEVRTDTMPITHAPPPARRRERSALSAFIFAAVLLLVGGTAILSSAEISNIDIGQLTALALFIVGIGLIVGAWWGRSRLMIVLGLLLIPLVLATSVVDFPLTHGIATGGYVFPRFASELDDLNYTFGNVTVDLSEYRFEEGTAQMDIGMGVGSVNVVVPSRVYAVVDVEARSGEAYVFRSQDSGTDISISEVAGDPEAAKRLDLNISAGLASVNVYRIRGGYLQRQHRKEQRAERRAGDIATKGRRGRRADR